MKSSKIVLEACFDNIVNESIECMKDELASKLRDKSLVYSFDFQAGIPNMGNSIFWSEKVPNK